MKHEDGREAEAINARIQSLKKTACGFRNRTRFRAAILFHLGGLDLYPEPVPFKVTLAAVSEDRRVTELPLKRIFSTSRDYEAVAKVLPRSGLYRVKAVLQGIDKKGERIEAESQVVSLAFSAGERSVVSTHAGTTMSMMNIKKIRRSQAV